MMTRMIHLPPTATKTRLNTKTSVNAKITEQTKSNINKYAYRSRAEIDRRLKELNGEWDTERTLQTNFGFLVLLSTVLGFKVNRKWFALGGIAAFFMIEHAVQGWCLPLPLIRHLGVRSADEINEEQTALMILRDGSEI